MARTIRTKIYKFEELSKEAKQVAIDWWRDGETFDYIFEEAWDSVKKFSEEFSIEMRNFDFLENYRSHYSFEQDDTILDLSGIRLRTYLINNFYSLFFEPKTYGKYEKRANGKYRYDRYSKCQFKETCCPFTGVCYDEYLLQPIRNFIAKPGNEDFKGLLEYCLSAICKTIESEIQYQSKDEQVAEAIIVNEYEFTKDGKRF